MYCFILMCYLYTIVLTTVTRNKDKFIYIYIYISTFSIIYYILEKIGLIKVSMFDNMNPMVGLIVLLKIVAVGNGGLVLVCNCIL